MCASFIQVCKVKEFIANGGIVENIFIQMKNKY